MLVLAHIFNPIRIIIYLPPHRATPGLIRTGRVIRGGCNGDNYISFE